MNIIFAFFPSLFFETWWATVFSVAYLVVWVFYVRGLLSVAVFKKFFIALIIFLVVRGVFQSVMTYVVWKSSEMGKYLLPPYQPVSYFLQYSGMHYAATFLLTTLFVIVFGFALWYAGKAIARGGLWKNGEEYIFLSGAFLVRWPLVIPYLFLGLLVALCISLAGHFLRRNASEIEISLALGYPLAAVLLLFFQEKVIHILSLAPLVMPL
jgi:hypothetical protein